MRLIATFVAIFVLNAPILSHAAPLSSPTTASSAPQAFPLSQYSNSRELADGIVVNGTRAPFDLSGSKRTSVDGDTYWTIPLTSNSRIGSYIRFAVFEVIGSSIRLIKVVPTTDTVSRYGYGNDLKGNRFKVERPFDRLGTKCCKVDKNFEYAISRGKVRLVRIYFSPELP